jgi:hypothetical protein
MTRIQPQAAPVLRHVAECLCPLRFLALPPTFPPRGAAAAKRLPAWLREAIAKKEQERRKEEAKLMKKAAPTPAEPSATDIPGDQPQAVCAWLAFALGEVQPGVC